MVWEQGPRGVTGGKWFGIRVLGDVTGGKWYEDIVMGRCAKTDGEFK